MAECTVRKYVAERCAGHLGAVGNYNPATAHPYEKPGFTFGQGHRLLLDTYRTEVSNNYFQDLKAALIDFRKGLEMDLDESAKHAGFFKQYSEANRALQIATSTRHTINQNIPMKVTQ